MLLTMSLHSQVSFSDKSSSAYLRLVDIDFLSAELHVSIKCIMKP